MPLRAAKWIVSRRLHATQSGGWGLWSGFGTTFRGGIWMNSESQPANGSSTNIRVIASIASSHIARLRLAIDQIATELGARARLPGAEVDPAVAHEVERRDALGDARRVVDGGRDLHDPVAEPDALGALARRGEKDLRGRGMRVLLEEVVLDLPDVVEAEPVGELDLVERVAEQRVLAALALPGPGVLVLVEDPEAHSADREGDQAAAPAPLWSLAFCFDLRLRFGFSASSSSPSQSIIDHRSGIWSRSEMIPKSSLPQ